MDCDTTMLTLYWSGELFAEEMGELERHLEICPTCRQELAELNMLQCAMAELPNEHAPRDFVSMTLNRINTPRFRIIDIFRKPALACPIFGSMVIAAAIMMVIMGPWSNQPSQLIQVSSLVPTDSSAALYAKAKNTVRHSTNRMTTTRTYRTTNFRARAGSLAQRIQLTKRFFRRNSRNSRTTR